ncbi:hypothetical protein RYH73_09240 [Olivibacter sp. CPCC 100613]|uniref:hypothetical protein n=1 Tax=Olivibacter sp. CPCC 100613 TaxID=3079931 RepID=UPI002FFC0108
MKKEKKMKKNPYVAPLITVELIAMEEGIATGSAMVRPVNDTGQIKTEWQEGTDISRDINWN